MTMMTMRVIPAPLDGAWRMATLGDVPGSLSSSYVRILKLGA